MGNRAEGGPDDGDGRDQGEGVAEVVAVDGTERGAHPIIPDHERVSVKRNQERHTLRARAHDSRTRTQDSPC